MRHWRKSTWALLLWCALIIVWVFAGVAASNCESEQYSEACEAGAGIGVLLVLFIGFVGFLFFSIIWFMTRPKNRQCPACGHDAKKGVMRCAHCGFDFASAVQVPVGMMSPGAANWSTPQAVAGQWAPDPYRRHELRYWDGSRWTQHVSSQGTTGLDRID